jgi:L-ribulose-5-phosphate 4-epimerase
MLKLKQQVFEANMDLPRYGLVTFTWGNVSAIDREQGLIVIKPSGVAYDTMKADDMVVVDLEGNVVDGKWRPSSDTATHLALYRRYPSLAVWCIPTPRTRPPGRRRGWRFRRWARHMRTTSLAISPARALTQDEVEGEYELNTGKVIIETLGECEPLHTPGIVVYQHGPFAWEKMPTTPSIMRSSWRKWHVWRGLPAALTHGFRALMIT